MIDSILASIIRTFVPVLVGLVVAAGAKAGFSFTDDTFTAIITAGVTTGYYALARYLEVKVSPIWGSLLGHIGAPQYVAPAAPVAPTQV